jgi:hypothetical protein
MWELCKKEVRLTGLAAVSTALVMALPATAGATATATATETATATAAAASSPSPGWQTYPAPVSGQAVLDGVVAPAPDDAWAGGFTVDANGFAPLMLHWDGSTWALSPTPPGDGELYDMTLTADGPWAVGDTYHESGVAYTAYALRWTGATWTNVVVPTTGDASLGAVAAIPGGGIWAVDSTADDASETPTAAPLIARYLAQ